MEKKKLLLAKVMIKKNKMSFSFAWKTPRGKTQFFFSHLFAVQSHSWLTHQRCDYNHVQYSFETTYSHVTAGKLSIDSREKWKFSFLGYANPAPIDSSNKRPSPFFAFLLGIVMKWNWCHSFDIKFIEISNVICDPESWKLVCQKWFDFDWCIAFYVICGCLNV